MKSYYINYRNEQGVLLRIITAVTRRGIPIETLVSTPVPANDYLAVVQIEPTKAQQAQLKRDWKGIIGVLNVREA